jgi:hypothetical protein
MQYSRGTARESWPSPFSGFFPRPIYDADILSTRTGVRPTGICGHVA